MVRIELLTLKLSVSVAAEAASVLIIAADEAIRAKLRADATVFFMVFEFIIVILPFVDFVLLFNIYIFLIIANDLSLM